MDIFDTNHDVRPQLGRIIHDGYHCIIRYVGPSGPPKCVTPLEAKAIGLAKLRLALVYEVWGSVAHAGSGGISRGDGQRAGKYAVDFAPLVGAPAGAAVYFAVDEDESAHTIANYTVPYFEAINDAFKGSPYKVGVYGSGLVCETIMNAKLAEFSWVTNAMGWADSRVYAASGKPNLVQHLPQTIAGLDTDPDVADTSRPFGDFVPFEKAS